jgi:hypothetical protein
MVGELLVADRDRLDFFFGFYVRERRDDPTQGSRYLPIASAQMIGCGRDALGHRYVPVSSQDHMDYTKGSGDNRRHKRAGFVGHVLHEHHNPLTYLAIVEHKLRRTSMGHYGAVSNERRVSACRRPPRRRQNAWPGLTSTTSASFGERRCTCLLRSIRFAPF